jgi:hypothetical protein
MQPVKSYGLRRELGLEDNEMDACFFRCLATRLASEWYPDELKTIVST